jgi:hypothetical protein
MKQQWTDAARAELENYFARVRPTLRASGADAEEVIEDLRRHLDAEVLSAKLPIVTEEDVRRLLTRIGAPQPAPDSTAQPAANNPTATASKPVAPKGGVLLLLFGILLPVATLVMEFLTGMCAGEFFDPIPSFWHVLLVALVPVANLLVWLALQRNDARYRDWLGWANGAAIGVAIFYSLIFAPLMLPGLIGVIFFGFGLLPLSPCLSLVAALFLRKKLQQLGANVSVTLPGFGRGIVLAWLALLVVQAPGIVTRRAVKKATSGETEEQLTGIRWLRAIGSEEALLRACYGYTARAQNADLLGWLVAGENRVSPEQARETYFRVTGRPFNSVPAPSVRTGRGAWAELNEWTWDGDQGGGAVGGRLKGLFLHSSRLDTTINAEAAWSYTEWTMEFRNDSRQQREARAQILLPPGGVVSRLTLRVNGEEREAAFAGRSQTREAYQKIAIQQRRDPVLVTTSGPDRVMMQCFPVPPDGGVMKIRFGITAPLNLASASEGLMRLPVLLERNFTVRKGFTHAVWAQAPDGLKSDCTLLALEPSNGGQVALRGQVDDAALTTPKALLRVKRDATRRFAWTKDTRSPGDRFIRQTITEESPTAPAHVIFVVDGSVGMKSHWQEIAEALGKFPSTVTKTILVASDRVETVKEPTALARITPVGGQDNLPALLHAWNLGAQKTNSVIVWVHGPQPMKLQSTEALLQAVERTVVPPMLYEIQTTPGPDRIIENLDGVRSLRPVLRIGSLSEDLARLIATIQGTTRTWKLARAVVDAQSAAEADGAMETSLHLARLWANDAIGRMKSKREIEPATKLAGLFQLVTPVSGAVVLETQQHYDQTGLQPVEVQTVPSIPEPSVGALVLAGLVLMQVARREANLRRSGRRIESAR